MKRQLPQILCADSATVLESSRDRIFSARLIHTCIGTVIAGVVLK